MQEILKETVSKFFQVDPHRIEAKFPLSGKRLQGSLARAQLDAAIRRNVGVKCPVVYSAKTYGELEQAILGNSSIQSIASSSSEAKSESSVNSLSHQTNGGALNNLNCGIDIELVENFPEVMDYWNDPFYSASFTAMEIAYCLLQENPRIHFASRWCAKEALKKCHKKYLHEEMGNLELVSDNTNSPFLRHYIDGVPTPIPFAVSVSHTPLFAVAVVMKSVVSVE